MGVEQMKVKATRIGYYNHKRRREDEIFMLKDESHFSERWMEKASTSAPVQIEEDYDDEMPKPVKRGKGKSSEPVQGSGL